MITWNLLRDWLQIALLFSMTNLGVANLTQPYDRTLWRIERFVAEVDTVRQALGLMSNSFDRSILGGWLAIDIAFVSLRLISLSLASTSARVPQFVAKHLA